MYSQEELNQLFPSDPLPDTRYSIGWYQQDTREIVIVFDKLSKKMVFRSNGCIKIDESGEPLSRIKQYKHIKKWYGKDNCDPPKQVTPSYYEGL